jgi:hypothetical protein
MVLGAENPQDPKVGGFCDSLLELLKPHLLIRKEIEAATNEA